MCVTICGRFCPDEGVVAGYDNRIRVKYTAKWGVQIAGMILGAGSRACLKKAFCKMCVTICGRFCPDEGVVAGYDNRIRVKYTAKWGVQIAGMIFQTGSRACLQLRHAPPTSTRRIPMEQLKIPMGYHADLNLHDTQVAIKTVKDFFQQTLAQKLNLLRVSAPIFVDPSSGLNDNLNGVERPVSFDIKNMEGNAEIVHSLAKWKRYALKKYGFAQGEGLYTDMVAIRRDEDVDNIHSIYVDQWDWEKIISKEERNVETLINTVRSIYSVLRKTEKYMAVQYDYIEEILPREIAFVSTEELVDMYPDLTPKEREYKIVKEKGAVFLMQVGKMLSNGERHDGRAPDYDDWELNGDILVYYPVLDIALELSSMGIRVDETALDKQLTEAGCDDRRELPFQKAILNKELPYTIGGGIGQSRICMFFLRKAHIGEVHVSLWPKEIQEEAAKAGIPLL